jgi:glycosyltransferase involved in cell wall biosynthesis
MAPRASIVIPLLNQVDAWLDRAIHSALDQTAECDVLVVTSPQTGESNRRMVRRIQSDRPKLRVVEHEPNVRFAGAINMGIRLAGSDRIGFLLSDDWLEPEAVEACLLHETDIVSTSQTNYAADGRTVLEEISGVRTSAAYGLLAGAQERAAFLGHFFLFQRKALEGVGGLDETLGDSPGVDDFDLIWCLLERNASVTVVPQSLYNYRDHDGDRLTTRSMEQMRCTFERILDKHGVFGAERERMMRHHSRWFGKAMWSVYQELTVPELPWLMRPLRSAYRTAIPFKTRLAIHDRWMEAKARKGKAPPV